MTLARFILPTTLIALIFVATPAAAQEESPGTDEVSGAIRASLLYSYGGGADLQHGFGLDLRYRLLGGGGDFHVGTFAQGQVELQEAFRFAGGIFGGFGPFSLELGVSHRTAVDGWAASTGLHIGKMITFGPVSIGGRLTIPLADQVAANVDGPSQVQGIEGSLFFAVGWGSNVHGERPPGRGCHPHGGGHGGHSSGHGAL